MKAQIHEDMLERLKRIPWFTKCGGKAVFDQAAQIRKNAVLVSVEHTHWGDLVLEERAHFTQILYADYRNEYSYWNDLAREFKDHHIAELRKVWEANLMLLGLDEQSVLDDIAFNVTTLVCLDAYREFHDMPDFFKRMLEIYEAGYLPCGWKGTRERGTLLYC